MLKTRRELLDLVTPASYGSCHIVQRAALSVFPGNFAQNSS